jgi:hypothetical protein
LKTSGVGDDLAEFNLFTGKFPAPWGVSGITKIFDVDTPLLAAGIFIIIYLCDHLE